MLFISSQQARTTKIQDLPQRPALHYSEETGCARWWVRVRVECAIVDSVSKLFQYKFVTPVRSRLLVLFGKSVEKLK